MIDAELAHFLSPTRLTNDRWSPLVQTLRRFANITGTEAKSHIALLLQEGRLIARARHILRGDQSNWSTSQLSTSLSKPMNAGGSNDSHRSFVLDASFWIASISLLNDLQFWRVEENRILLTLGARQAHFRTRPAAEHGDSLFQPGEDFDVDNPWSNPSFRQKHFMSPEERAWCRHVTDFDCADILEIDIREAEAAAILEILLNQRSSNEIKVKKQDKIRSNVTTNPAWCAELCLLSFRKEIRIINNPYELAQYVNSSLEHKGKTSIIDQDILHLCNDCISLSFGMGAHPLNGDMMEGIIKLRGRQISEDARHFISQLFHMITCDEIRSPISALQLMKRVNDELLGRNKTRSNAQAARLACQAVSKHVSFTHG